MPATLRRRGLLVLDEWERTGRDARQRAELPRQVRLVSEAVVGGQAGERHAADPGAAFRPLLVVVAAIELITAREEHWNKIRR